LHNNSTACRRSEAITNNIAVVHQQNRIRRIRSEQNSDGRTGIETLDVHVFDAKRGASYEIDSDKTGGYSLDFDIPQGHVNARAVNIDAVRARSQNRAQRAGAVDRDRFGNGDGAETARIDAVDLAVRGGFRDRAGKRLAGRRAAARTWPGTR